MFFLQSDYRQKSTESTERRGPFKNIYLHQMIEMSENEHEWYIMIIRAA